MKTDFFEQIKKFILSEHKEDRYFLQYIRYYETMLQNKDVLKPLFNDLDNWRLDIHFEDDKTEGYTYGKYILYLWNWVGDAPEDDYDYGEKTYLDHHYEIELTRDERYWGYCTCSPDDEGYNDKHRCCGNGCDWVAPAFTLRKIEEWSVSFKGVERDIWKLEEKWNEHLSTYNEKVRQDRLKRIDEQLASLRNEREKLIK